MRRREVILLLGGATAWPILAYAQSAAHRPRIGHIGILNYAGAQYARVIDFRDELRRLGYVEDRNLIVSHLWADGNLDRLPGLAAELIQRKVDLIIALGPSAWAAKRATITVPIVIAFSGDLVGTGMLSNLARPGGNITGFSYLSTDLAAKRLELLSETFSRSGRIAVLYNPGEPATTLELQETEAAARALGVTLQPLAAGDLDAVDHAFATASHENADGMILFTHGFAELNQARIIEQAALHRMPTLYGWRDFSIGGGLMSYGPDVKILVREAASYVDRILKGERPGDLPVQQTVRLELIVNLKTARAVGIAIPPALLSRADEVIE
jgi:putative tryptophan/tyrosine transport system substrate-binding protein